MKNKNVIRTFKKNAFSLIKIVLVLIKKAERHWMNSKIRKISKGKKVNKSWKTLFDQHKVEFKN